MKVFKNVKYTGIKYNKEADAEVTNFENENGIDWYEERKGWSGGVIAVWPNDGNLVASWAKLAIEYVPVDGQTLYEIDNSKVPEFDVMKLLGKYTYNGEQFEKIIQVKKVRTKEDILADLEKLKEELLYL